MSRFWLSMALSISIGTAAAMAQAKPAMGEAKEAKIHIPLGVYGFGSFGASLGIVPSFSKHGWRGEASYEALKSPAESGAMLGVRGGRVFTIHDRITMPILIGWRFADMDNDCEETCSRFMTHTLALDMALEFALGSSTELRLGLSYGFPIANADWRGGAERRVTNYFGGPHLFGATLGLGWRF